MRRTEGERSRRTRLAIAWIGLAPVILIATAFLFAHSQAASAPQAVAARTQTIEHLSVLGTSTIHAIPLGTGAVEQPEIDNVDRGDSGLKGGAAIASQSPRRKSNLPIPSKEAARRAPADRVAASKSAFPPEPTVESDVIVPYQGLGFQGFNGLSHVDSREANSGNQFSVEPPDQGLCVGNGYVVEVINDAIRVFDTEGNPLTGVEDVNSFFGLPAAIIRKPNPKNDIIGPSLSDPKCFFDNQTRRWFVSELMGDTGNNRGATGRNFNVIAVSQTDHPTGAFTVFRYDVTDDGVNGTPNHAGCPCFGDQPLIGTDKFGFYQTTNEFGANFNGAQIYAISKDGLVDAANGSSPPIVVHIDASQQLVPFGGLSYSIQPATAPAAVSSSQIGGITDGVEYFLSALQFIDTFDNRIAVWAITNTQSLDSNAPILTLSFDVIRSETYGQPNPAFQKAGDIPLAKSQVPPQPLEFLNTNDDRMNQVIFAHGILYGGVNTLLRVAGEEHQGIAWFAVEPRFEGPTLKGRVVRQDYIAVADEDVFFPSIGVNDDGDGAIAFSLSGEDTFPSAAYVDMVDGSALPFVHIAAAGRDSDDGFSAYPAFNVPQPGVGRWGDYSAAVADGDSVWFASEYIPRVCRTNALPCRTALANWGTFVSKVRTF
jgi:hypothetical protein